MFTSVDHLICIYGSFTIALLCYIWAFCSQSHKLPAFKNFLYLCCVCRTSELRGAQNIYYSAFSLLIFDGFTIILGILLLKLKNNTLLIFFNIWLAFQYLSQCQHLITALISILFAYRPSWGNGLCDASKALNVVPFILFINFSYKTNIGILIGVDVYNFLLFVGIVVSLCLSSSSPIANQRTPFGLLSVSFYLIICLPSAVINILTTHFEAYIEYAWYVLLLSNVYIIMNALLFRLVLKVEDGNQGDNPNMNVREQF